MGVRNRRCSSSGEHTSPRISLQGDTEATEGQRAHCSGAQGAGGCAGCEARLVIASQLTENNNVVAGGRARDNEADEPERVGNLSWHVDARGEEACHGEATEWHEHETC